MIRVAAVGDVHFDRHSGGRLSSHFDRLRATADLFLIAGDLTQTGHRDEGKVLAEDLAQSPVPVVVVLGNHDYNMEHEDQISEDLRSAGVTVLEQGTVSFELAGKSVGIVGLKGFGGGFANACATDFGEKQMKYFIRHTKELSQYMREALVGLQTDYRIALLHYSPVAGTLHGEKLEIYPFLGSYLLGEAIDSAGADLVFHGHAHRGVERGETPGGVPVRNVAQHVIRHVFNVYSLG